MIPSPQHIAPSAPDLAQRVTMPAADDFLKNYQCARVPV